MNKNSKNKRESVSVFWDYENCPCPANNSFSRLITKIKNKIDHYVGKKLNKQIQLYAPMNRLHPKSREDANDCGVIMMDVASKRKQESVDKRIIADIGLFAADLASSGDLGIIVLISGDSDFGYILSRLRDRHYIKKIILFTQQKTRDTLTCHADHVDRMFYQISDRQNPFRIKYNDEYDYMTQPQFSLDNDSMFHPNAEFFKLNNKDRDRDRRLNSPPDYRKDDSYFDLNKTRKMSRSQSPSSRINNNNNSHNNSKYHIKNKNNKLNNYISPKMIYVKKQTKKDTNKNISNGNNDKLKVNSNGDNKDNNNNSNNKSKLDAPSSIPLNPLGSPSRSKGGIFNQDRLEAQLRKQQSYTNTNGNSNINNNNNNNISNSNNNNNNTISDDELNLNNTSAKALYFSDDSEQQISKNINKSKFNEINIKKIQNNFLESIANIFDNKKNSNNISNHKFKECVPSITEFNKKHGFNDEPKLLSNDLIIKKKQIRMVCNIVSQLSHEGKQSPKYDEVSHKMMKVFKDDYISKEFCLESIKHALYYGYIEELLKGRVSNLNVLPYLLRYAQTLKVDQYYSIGFLSNQLSKKYPQMVNSFGVIHLENLLSRCGNFFQISKHDYYKISNKNMISDIKYHENIKWRPRSALFAKN